MTNENISTRRRLLESIVLTLLLIVIGAATVTGSAAEARASSAELKVQHPERVRILQLTDLHFFSRDKSTWDEFNQRTVDNMRKLVARAKPDLIVVTGDLWSEDQGGLGESHVRYAIKQLETLGVPWAFVWGNHDQLANYAVGHEAFTRAKNSLYRGATSDGNYAINILDKKGRRVWQLLCLNSHRDGLQREQQEWVEALVKADPQPVARFAFFHIPLKQYEEVWASGVATGIHGEKVSKEKQDGSTLPVLKAAGVKACFCGHDHENDYSGVYDGVDLVYGRVSRSGGYAPEIFPKGAKLITLNCKTGKYNWVTLTVDGKQWRPKPGERVDRAAR